MSGRESARLKSLRDFMGQIGYTFADSELLDEALTHSSYAHEQGLPYWNERLEFLGDAVLELLISEHLFREHPKAAEGELTRARTALVREESLSAWARALGIESLLRAGKGARQNISENMLGDTMEAVIGALYLDGGLEAARRFVDTRPRTTMPLMDAKTRLQALCQCGGGEPPRYELVSREGPEHEPVFTVRAVHGEKELARGSGGSRKLAEQDAARRALALAEADKSAKIQ